jgi:hypothetical protein
VGGGRARSAALLAAVLALASCGGGRADDPSASATGEIAFPARSEVFAGDSSFLLAEQDPADEVISDPSDDVRPRLVEVVTKDDRLVERTIPGPGGDDLSEPSALQLPDGGWLLSGVPCPADPDVLVAECGAANVAPFVRRLGRGDRTWTDVGRVPRELRDHNLNLVGLDGDVAVFRAVDHREDRPDWSYWTLDLSTGAYGELWRAEGAAALRFDCVTGGRLVVVDEDEAGASHSIPHRISLTDVDSARSDAHSLDVGPVALQGMVCGQDGAFVVGMKPDGATPVAVAIHADGTPGPPRAGPHTPAAFGGTSDRNTVVLVAQVGSEGQSGSTVGITERNRTTSLVTSPPTSTHRETMRMAIFHAGTWRTASVTADAVDFVHPGITGDHVLLEHRDDRWTLTTLR